MNKILNIIKYILSLIVIILYIKLVTNLRDYGHIFYILSVILLTIITILLIKDLIKKDKINNNNIYNIICILTSISIIFIFYRTYIDKNLIPNDKVFISEYKETYKNIFNDTKEDYIIEPFDLNQYRTDYFLQNTIYFFILESLIIIYRRINIEKTSKQN